MSWSDDEKRAALSLLSRIAEVLEASTITPEKLAAFSDEADRLRASRDNDPAPVLTIADGAADDTAPIDVDDPDYDDRVWEHHRVGQCSAKIHDTCCVRTCCVRLAGHFGEHRNYFGQRWLD